jgi:two-component system sensor histidine kinase CreC
VSTRGRIFLGVLLVFVLGLGWLMSRVIDDLGHRYRESAEELLVDTAQLLAALVATDIVDGVIHADRLRLALPTLHRQRFEARIFEAVKRDVNLRIYLADRSGRVIYDSQGRHEGEDFSGWRDVRLTLQGRYGARTTRDAADDPVSSVMYVAAPVFWQGEIAGVVSVGKPTRSYLPFVEAARHDLIVVGATSGLTVVLLAIGVAVWLVRPFGLIADYIRLIRNHQRAGLPRLGRSALGVLGAAWDEIRDALAGRNYVEDYVQALTHEIKSPLSAIRGAAELLHEDMPPVQRDRFLGHIRTESGRIQDLVDRLLELSALEKRRRLTGVERIALAPLIHATLESLGSTAAARAVVFRHELPERRYVEGDRFLLQRALANLLQNALEFSPEGADIEVRLSSSGYFHDITVRDHGPGIPEYAENRVFDRFYSLPRPGTGKKSTGLGLSFVKEIAELHRGSVELANHAEGGAVALFKVPASRRGTDTAEKV